MIEKVTEATIQAVLMRWLMNEKKHEYVIPNSNSFFSWEADLLSVTKAGLVHELEVKLNIYDYRADAKKHKWNYFEQVTSSPAYFWYATYDFEITPPNNAGWILVTQQPKLGWRVTVKKEAPRLNLWKVDTHRREAATRLLSWRLVHEYERMFLRESQVSK